MAGWLSKIGTITLPTALALAAPAADARQSAPGAALEALRAADVQLAAIGFRLSVAAAPLCDRLEPGTGIQFHTLAQYPPSSREQVRAHFELAGPLGVEGVAPDSPAARAGVKANDTILSINGIPVSTALPTAATTDALTALHAQIAALPPTTPISLTVIRDGRQFQLQIEPVSACFSRYELRIADNFDARANGELVQITSKYLEAVDPHLLPAVIAHELSHNILRHRERLTAAGAAFGLASGFGRNVALFRQTEIEADILAVHLLARAGYEPTLAERFWREAGPQLNAGRIRSRSHPSLKDRIAIARTEAARFNRNDGPPALPPFALERTRPLDGGWQRYLPKTR